jgi:exopolyphosphatase/pppGpp-phosphohydrolase
MSSHKFSETIQEKVRQRAKYLCEYCHACEQWQYVRFSIDHVIPINIGGSNNLDNLALACFHCNRRKGSKIKATDPQSKQEVNLYNPRLQYWGNHFIWSADGLTIIGLTKEGRATINLLSMNRERVLNIRKADILVSRHPPKEDPILR